MKISDSNEDAISQHQRHAKQVETRIETQHTSQADLFSSLQNIVPDIELSLQVISFFNNRPFTPTPLPPPKPNNNPNRHLKKSPIHEQPTSNSQDLKREDDSSRSVRGSEDDDDDSEKFTMDESENPLTVVRSKVAVCLLQRVPFTAIESSTVLRKLENDQSATD